MKQNKKRKRIGLFGGSFDPPHVGHCIIAARAADQLKLDKVLFIPAHIPPHKKHRSTSDSSHRLAMTRLAIRGRKTFACSDQEVRRKGVSYTVDTLRDIKGRFPDAELFLIIGGDSLAFFPSWREPEAILKLARLAVYDRPKVQIKRRRRDSKRFASIAGPLLDISSSGIRTMVAAGRSITFLVPQAVERYIRSHRLYHRKNA